jgi:hypothetical protein
MSFPLTPAAPFTPLVSVVPATVLNDWRVYLSRSLDTVNGGAYTNVTTIDWLAGSAGWRFYAALAIKSTGSLIIDGGATVTINASPTINGDVNLYGILRCQSGGGFRVYSGATAQYDSGSTTTCSGTTTHASGSSSTFAAGSTLAINTALATLGQDSVLTVNGASGHVAQVIRGQYSTDTFQSGAGCTWNSGALCVIGSGAFVTWTIGGGGNAGSVTWGASSTQTHASGSADTYASGSALTVNAGTVVNITIGQTNAGTTTWGGLAVSAHKSGSSDTYEAGSALNLDGTVTRTGKQVLSGAGAWTQIRRVAGGSSSVAINGKAQEILYAVGDASVDITYTLDDTGAGEKVMFWLHYRSNGHKLIVNNSLGTLIEFTGAINTDQTIQFYCNGSSDWNFGLIGAVH